MASFIIEGGKKLEGEVKISGSKNASLPIIAASILNKNKTKLYNVPDIHDTQITLKILRYLGCKVNKSNDKIEINSKYINKKEIPEHLMREMRSTVILAGAILGRFKEVTFSYPGGCDIWWIHRTKVSLKILENEKQKDILKKVINLYVIIKIWENKI